MLFIRHIDLYSGRNQKNTNQQTIYTQGGPKKYGATEL